MYNLFFTPLLAILPLVNTASENMDGEGPFLSVMGQGEVKLVPDLAVVELGVTDQASSAQTAQEKVNSTVQLVIKALDRLGIEPGNIQTSQLNLQPVYAAGRSAGEARDRRIVGYRASYSLSVKTAELVKTSQIIDASLEAGANQLRGVQFGLQDEGPARREALKKAVSDAAAKATALAEAAGIRILAVQEILEGNLPVRPVSLARSSMMATEAMAAPTSVMPGEMEISAVVTIRYAIEAAQQ